MKYVVGCSSDTFDDDVELIECYSEDEAYKFIRWTIANIKLKAQNPKLVRVEDMNSLGDITLWTPDGVDDERNRGMQMIFYVMTFNEHYKE